VLSAVLTREFDVSHVSSTVVQVVASRPAAHRPAQLVINVESIPTFIITGLKLRGEWKGVNAGFHPSIVSPRRPKTGAVDKVVATGLVSRL
jgi:hypothetical protein